MRMRNSTPPYIRNTLLVACVGLLACATFNAFTDVEAVYFRKHFRDGQGVRDYVAALREHPEGVLPDSRERPVKVELLRQSDADCFVIGSSQVNMIRQSSLSETLSACNKFINLAVSGAAFEDYVSFLAILAEKPKSKRVVVAMPPWIFRMAPDGRWRLAENLYDEGRRFFGLRLRAPSVGLLSDWVGNLFNYQYLMRNIGWLIDGRTLMPYEVRPVPFDQRHLEENAFVLMPDGSLMRSAPPKAGQLSQALDVGNGDYKIRPPMVNSTVVREFETVLRQLLSLGITPVLLMTPYNPLVWRCKKPIVCETMIEVEGLARDLAKRLGIRVVGGFNPRRFGITEDEFFDAHHMAERGVRKLEHPVDR